MSTHVIEADPTASFSAAPAPSLHQLRAVRELEEASLRSVAVRLRIPCSKARRLEDETTDMPLSELYRWSKALGVPASNLLQGPQEAMSDALCVRAKLLRMMKTVRTLADRAPEPSVRRLADRFAAELLQIMPELQEVPPWPREGSMRSGDPYGRILEQIFPADWFK